MSECFAYQQAEFFFSQQAAFLEAKESDALPPAALQNKIRQVLKSNPDLTQAVSKYFLVNNVNSIGDYRSNKTSYYFVDI